MFKNLMWFIQACCFSFYHKLTAFHLFLSSQASPYANKSCVLIFADFMN